MTSLNDDKVCPQCGAIGCKEKYEAMLALEYEQPEVFGAVHHTTVICYNLQHPDTFTDGALMWMRSSLRAIVEDGLSGPELLKRARRTFSGNARVTAAKAAPAEGQALAKWSKTTTDIHTDNPDVYVNDVKAWAASILKDFDAK